MFLLTCVSTCFAGATGWLPGNLLFESIAAGDALPLRRAILVHWQDGLTYMVCVLAILLTHEMGHFLATVKYHIPASFPFFLPLPISSIGTMGAVIAMDGRRADRRQTFDIGLAGPLAGLFVTLPVLWMGIRCLDASVPAHGPHLFNAPLAMQLLVRCVAPSEVSTETMITLSQLNPYLMAGCVGLLITGLNMLPVGQLDGGHVTYMLLGRRGRWIARTVIGLIWLHVGWHLIHWTFSLWTLMAILLLMIGPNHPPTRDDTVPLGWFRTALGVACLAIPLLCLPTEFL